MFRQPTQAEYEYLLPYLKNTENMELSNLNNNMNPLRLISIGLIILGVLTIPLSFIFSLFFWFVAFEMFNGIKRTNQMASTQMNNSGTYIFEIMDCTLVDVFYRKNDPNLHPKMVNQEPMGNVLMPNGVKIPTYFIPTQESNAMGITNFNNHEYNISAYYIKNSNNGRNYVIVKP